MNSFVSSADKLFHFFKISGRHIKILPTKANAQTHISISVGGEISWSQDETLLRNRGFRDGRRIDCRGRFLVYRAWRGSMAARWPRCRYRCISGRP